jgi:hypothetical protein
MGAGQTAIITLAALLAGGGLWFALVWRQQRTPWNARSLGLLLLLLGLGLRLAYVFLTPVFYAPDEQSHVNYLKYLSEHRAFPVLAGKMGETDNEWEYFQPPLYYLAALPIYWATDHLFHQTAVTVFALRLGSVLLWLLNLRLGLTLLKRLEIRDELLWLGALTLACLLPTYVFVSAAVNNDNLMITMGTAVACLLATRQPSLKNALALGLLLGLSLWVKQSALVFVPAVVALRLLAGFKGQQPWPAALAQGAGTLAIAALLYLPWALRNWQVYGTFTPEDLSAAVKTWPSAVDGLISATHNLAKTFWSVSGISNNIGYPFPLLGMAFAAVALGGLGLGWKQDPKALCGPLTATNALVLTALLFAALVNVILVLRFGYLYGMGQGRHLFPLLGPLALLLTWGFRAFPAKNIPLHLVGFWTTYALAFEAFSLCRFPR